MDVACAACVLLAGGQCVLQCMSVSSSCCSLFVGELVAVVKSRSVQEGHMYVST